MPLDASELAPPSGSDLSEADLLLLLDLDEDFRPEEYDDGSDLYMSLAWKPATSEAEALCAEVLELIKAERRHANAPGWEQPRMASVRLTIGGIIGDLVAAWSSKPARLLFRPWSTESFAKGSSHSVAGIGRRLARSVREALKGLAFLKVAAAHRRFCWSKMENGQLRKQPDLAATYRVTDRFAALAAKHGVDGTRHFWPLMPAFPVALSVQQEHFIDGKRAETEPMMIPTALQQASSVRRDVHQLCDLNRFLDSHALQFPDGRPAFHGLRRLYLITKEAMTEPLEAYGWNRHGRFYTKGVSSHQSLPKPARRQLTVGGKAVAEVDVSASHLTAIYGLLDPEHGVRWQHEDPYLGVINPATGEELPRPIVKAALTPMITNGGRYLRQWKPETAEKLLKVFPRLQEDYPPEMVGKAILQAHPVLKAWKDGGGDSQNLVYRESQVLLDTMLQAKKRGITAYPIHDSLLIPSRYAHTVASMLKDAFAREFGCRPRVWIER